VTSGDIAGQYDTTLNIAWGNDGMSRYGISNNFYKTTENANYFRDLRSYGLQIWPLHSQGPFEHKLIKNFGDKEWTYPGTAQIF